MKKVRDEFGLKIKYPERHCTNCKKYPCFIGIYHCSSDFASYGCDLYVENGNISRTSSEPQ